MITRVYTLLIRHTVSVYRMDLSAPPTIARPFLHNLLQGSTLLLACLLACALEIGFHLGFKLASAGHRPSSHTILLACETPPLTIHHCALLLYLLCCLIFLPFLTT